MADGEKRYHLSEQLEQEIISLAKRNRIEKLYLFGSRARGTNHERSDVDLAASGGDVLDFAFDVDEETQTLLMFDVVDLNASHDKDLLAAIERDGVLLYEKI